MLINIDLSYCLAGPDWYANAYEHKAHASLAKRVHEITGRWMLTCDDVTEIRDTYAELPQYRTTLINCAQVNRSAVELLVLSRYLIPPTLLLAEPETA